MNAAHRDRIGDALTYLAMLVIFTFFAWPLLWLLSLALRTRREVFLGVSRFIPKNPTLENFAQILQSDKFLGYLVNALKLSCLSAIGCLIVALPAAYAFSRFEFKGKGAWMMALLSVQMISPLVIMVPLYRYMAAIGLTDTHFGATMVYIALAVPMVTWILKGSMDGIPKTLDEAAMIDGCNRFTAFFRVILPLSMPGIASAFIIAVITGWSQFLVPFLLIQKEALTPIAVGIFQYAGTQNDTSIQLLAAACLVSVVPAIIAFLSLQRLILGAMTAGAVKG
ncbi:ABC transporter permease [Xaviernesmea oryzae]|uniref:ABC transporter permease n=1 Tax=Xaviernesmea oryzae TaxID=464029 RepID=A0A1Q9AQQ6_9HYPH|nr:carbohydrate ABC transporter permease [Xaviernesmea oryzae]OLP57752.1 ABC transporter permease [Xaviernesmea oryzae]SEM06650.1 multiple sugar transport system permease protein [Xaviernesmea oryzae]